MSARSGRIRSSRTCAATASSVISSPGNTVAATINVGASPTAAAVATDGRRAHVVNGELELGQRHRHLDADRHHGDSGRRPSGRHRHHARWLESIWLVAEFLQRLDRCHRHGDQHRRGLADCPGLDAPCDRHLSRRLDSVRDVAGRRRVFPVDVATHIVNASISSASGQSPWPSAGWPRAFVANYLSSNVSVIDVSSQTLIMQLPANSPSSVAVSPDGANVPRELSHEPA